MEQPTMPITWTENIIIADADYIDHVAFDLTVNFERMLMRRIPPADMARWAECIALDGGLRPKDNATESTHLILIHDKAKTALDNFLPANYDKELNSCAFKGPLGEFTISALPVEETTTKTDFLLDTMRLVCAQKDVKRVMVIPNTEEGTVYDDIRTALHRFDDDTKRITVFAMQPMPGGNFRQEILGYSLMNALGIHAEEIKTT
ncbi:MAG: hypothetical protein J5610_04855 [Prevotella sp.]|nr:hypothetical protein [Prevotella sp.]